MGLNPNTTKHRRKRRKRRSRGENCRLSRVAHILSVSTFKKQRQIDFHKF